MDDFEDLPVETVAGERPAGAVGDRLLIGLAGLALLGGLLIAAGNFLSGFLPESALEPSATPDPTVAEPARTARPTPTERPLRELGIIPGEPPEEERPPFLGQPAAYWLEALEPLAVYASQGGQGEPIGRIAAGEVAAAEDPGSGDEDGWLFVYDPQGWARAVDERGNATAILHDMERPRFPSTVLALAAGPAGFVAQGQEYVDGWGPSRTIALSSADGERWLPGTGAPEPGIGGMAAAWGPSGWLAVRTSQWAGPPRTWVWESATGDAWSPVGELGPSEESYVKQLVASDLGYLLAFGLGTPELSSLWYSPDGLVWQESLDPFASVPGSEYPEDNVKLAASSNGFLAWRLSDRQAEGVVAAFSRDGRTWTPIELSGDGSAAWIQLAPVGESVIGVGQDLGGSTRAYEASLDDGAADSIKLVRAPHLDLAFDGAGVWTLVSDGTSAYAFGFERSTSRDAVWRGDGRTWRRIAAPAGGFNEPVRLAAAGPAGVVALGGEPNGVVSDPVLWHLGADGAWVRQVGAAFPAVPAVGRDDCGEPPDSAVEFMGLHPTVAVPCFGSRPMSFTAWSTEACEGCSGGGPLRGGSWLADPEHTLFLLPMESGPNGFGGWKEAVPGPDLAWRDEYVGAWLRITGHYDDPAAEGCARPPEPSEAAYYPGTLAEVSFCRQRFVITEATVVERPGS